MMTSWALRMYRYSTIIAMMHKTGLENVIGRYLGKVYNDLLAGSQYYIELKYNEYLKS